VEWVSFFSIRILISIDFVSQIQSKTFSNLFIILGKIQKANRAGINPEDVQPTGNKYFLSSILMLFRDLYPIGLPVWRDPFDRKKAG
jgi:hypothetical protein